MALNRSEVRRLRLFDLEQVRHRQHAQEWVPHWHDEWSFGAIVQGECCCSVAGRPFLARTGDLIAIAPGIVHTGALTAPTHHGAVLVIMLYVPTAWLDQSDLAAPARSGSARAPVLAREARDLASPADVQAWLRRAIPSLAKTLRPNSSVAGEPIPTDAVRALRLHRAKRMVMEGQPVASVAAECGFADQAH